MAGTRWSAAELDRLRLEYALAVRYRERVSAARPGAGGYLSSCCGGRTYERRGMLRCAECGMPCEPGTWLPTRAGYDKGGWQPEKGLNLIYCKETRTRRQGMDHERLWNASKRMGSLGTLFEPRARSWTIAAWHEAGVLWDLLNDPQVKGYPSVAELVRLEVEVVRATVRDMREVIRRRLQDHPGDYPGITRWHTSGSRPASASASA